MSQLQEIKDILEKHVKSSEEMAEKLDDMYFIIIGNKAAKIDGIADKVYKHEKYIQSDKKIKWMGTGAMSILNLGFFAWIKQKLGL